MSFDLGTIFASVSLNTAQLDKGLMATQLKIAQADTSISSFGQKMSLNSTKFLAAGAIMSGAVLAIGVAAIKAASQFDTSMRNVNSISKLSEEAFAAQSKEVVNLSKTLPQSAKVLADGLYDIASSGFQGADGMKVLEAAAKAASAGLTTTAVSAKGVTAVLNAYGLSADDAAGISDTMFRTVDKGVLSFEELSSQIGEVVGTANIAGIGFNELSGMIAYMTTKGIDAAESTTALNRMMLAIITPTDALAAVLKNAGYESGQMALEQIGLTGVMALIEKAANGDVAAINAMSGDMRAFKAVASLTGSGIEELNNFMADFKDTTGATAIALKEQSKALSFQLDILKNNATALGIELGQKLIPPIANLVKKLNELDPAVKDNIYSTVEMTLKVVAAGGAVLLLAGAFGKLRMIMLANPIMAIVAGFIALNGAVDIGSGKLEEMNTVWGTLGAQLLKLLAPMVSVKDGLSDNITVMKAIADGTLSWKDAQDLNIFTMDEHIKKINELRAAEKREADGQKSEYEEGLANMTAYRVAQHQGIELTREQIVVNTDNENAITSLMAQYPNLTREQAILEAANRGLIKSTEETTGAEQEQVKTIDELRGAYNELIATLFDGINANNTLQESEWAQVAAQKEVNRLIKEGKQGTQEYEQAVNTLDGANQSVIESLYGVYTSTYTTKQEQESAKQKALEFGLQMVATGQWGEEAFISMASQFGMSAQDIIDWADKEGKAIDYATRGRLMIVDKAQAEKDIDAYVRYMSKIPTEINTRVNTYYTDIYGTSGISTAASKFGAMGGMITASGIQQFAAGGMVIPQTGRAIPILAHEGEMILNDSQQGNLINALWGVANGKDVGGGGGVTVNLTVISPDPITPSEVARTTKNALRLYGLEAALQ